MSTQAVKGIIFLSACIPAVGYSAAITGGHTVWYSNGYVLETSILRAPNGQIDEQVLCEWRESLRQLECRLTRNGESTITQKSYNSAGRIIQELTGSSTDNWLTQTNTFYQNDRIFESVETGYAESQYADVTRYNWQADTLLDKNYYFGAYPVLDKSQFAPEKVIWTNGRISSIAPSAPAADRQEHDEREVYSYKNNGQVQSIGFEDWNPKTQAWSPRLITQFHYSAAGNISHTEHFDAKGLLELTREFTWQKTDSVVENISYTIGRL